jgi:hypothetical protein
VSLAAALAGRVIEVWKRRGGGAGPTPNAASADGVNGVPEAKATNSSVGDMNYSTNYRDFVRFGIIAQTMWSISKRSTFF